MHSQLGSARLQEERRLNLGNEEEGVWRSLAGSGMEKGEGKRQKEAQEESEIVLQSRGSCKAVVQGEMAASET